MRYFRLTRPTWRDCVAAGLIPTVVVAAVCAFRGLGPWLLVRDNPPERLDVIFVFGGETARETYGLRLSEQYPDAVLVISANRTARVRALLGPSLDTSRTVIVDSLKNTWDEVHFLRRWLAGYRRARAAAQEKNRQNDSLAGILAALERKGNVDSAGGSGRLRPAQRSRPGRDRIHVALVSGPYHMRRIKMATVRLLNNPTVRLFYTPVPLEQYGLSYQQYSHWWRRRDLRSLVWSETRKTLYYLVRL